jgi:hypothetical protein
LSPLYECVFKTIVKNAGNAISKIEMLPNLRLGMQQNIVQLKNVIPYPPMLALQDSDNEQPLF